MDFSLTEEQILLRSSVARFFRDHYPFDARMTAVRSAEGWRPSIWRRFADELGILGLAVPASLGGTGAGSVEIMIVMEEIGRALAVEPYLETAVIGAGLMSRIDSGVTRDALRRIACGEMVTAFAWAEPGMRYNVADISLAAARQGDGWRLDGGKSVVIGAPWATHIIVAARTQGRKGDVSGLSLFLVKRGAEGLKSFDYPTMDGRRASDLIFDDSRVAGNCLIGTEGEACALIEEAIDQAIAASCAEAVGAMQRMLDDTIAYTGERRQFGRPLADFQVLQHRMVDMFMRLEMARSATYLVTLRLQADRSARALASSSAKVTVADAARFIGQNAIQLHGGMGMTDDLPIGHYFKRTTMIEGEFGTADHHIRRHAHVSRHCAA